MEKSNPIDDDLDLTMDHANGTPILGESSSNPLVVNTPKRGDPKNSLIPVENPPVLLDSNNNESISAATEITVSATVHAVNDMDLDSPSGAPLEGQLTGPSEPVNKKDNAAHSIPNGNSKHKPKQEPPSHTERPPPALNPNRQEGRKKHFRGTPAPDIESLFTHKD